MGEFRYDDILNVEYPNPEIEKDFPDKILREAQFAPFAALTGHDAAIEETARLTGSKTELDEYSKDELNRKLNFIKDCTDDEIFVKITYFVADKKKAGGKYITKSGTVTKVREFEKDIVLDDGTVIPIDDIFEIDGDELNITEE